MARKKLPGLYFDASKGTGHVDKRLPGIGRVFGRFTARTAAEAETEYYRILREAEDSQRRPAELRTWRRAVTRYLNESTKATESQSRDASIAALLDPWIGTMRLDQIHQGTLQPYIDDRRAAGAKSATVVRHLALVSRILTLAARVWRDTDGRPWLPQAVPLLEKPDWRDDAQPYPLSHDEQRRLFQHLPQHLAEMALFAVHTGARDQEICGLRWEWETRVPELGVSVFVLPGRPRPEWEWTGTKNGEDAVLILNRIARTVIDARRGNHPEWVFDYRGRRILRINNTAWRNAWRSAGLPVGPDVLSGPHNLRHTFARRLRAAGVNKETRKALMHHSNDDITVHYSPAELAELLTAVEKLCQTEQPTILRVAR